MKPNHYFFVALLLILSSSAMAGNCEVIGKVNEIVNKENSNNIFINSSCLTQQRISAYVYQWIYDGDHFEIIGDAEVHVILAKGERRVLTQHDSGKTLRDQSVNDIYDRQNSVIGKFTIAKDVWQRLERQRKSIPFFNKVRGPGQNLKVRNDPLLPPGLQFLPAGYEQIALVWRGGPATVVLVGDGKISELHSGNWSYLFIPISKTFTESSIRLFKQEINWQIKIASEIPTPEGIKESDLSSPFSQLMRALWILEQQDLVYWKLFALSELARLSQIGIFSAEELWKAALSGELATALQAI